MQEFTRRRVKRIPAVKKHVQTHGVLREPSELRQHQGTQRVCMAGKDAREAIKNEPPKMLGLISLHIL